MSRAARSRAARDPALRLADKGSLAGEVIAAYVRARRLAARGSLPDTLAQLRATPATLAPRMCGDPVQAGRRLARVTARTLSVLPADTRCLNRSLTLTALLARRGMATSLVIAVRPGEAFGAHAWVEYAGRPLLPAAEAGYGELVRL